jgi:7-cyano-7-deazaguanine reductase
MNSDFNFILGKETSYPECYDKSLLCPINRPERTLGMKGCDIWTAYEVSWLLPSGKPQVAIGQLTIPASCPFLIESKSLKLYLNSLNSHTLASFDDVEALVTRDLSDALECDVTFEVFALEDAPFFVTDFVGNCIDDLDILISEYSPTPALLSVGSDEVEETLVSHLFRSNCPVTSQPDWASVQITYKGKAICHKGLLAYLVSYRHHEGFHEQCVESIYADILSRCSPDSLSVYARFTRRGGLDINPFRSTDIDYPLTHPIRLIRQ